MPFYFGWLSAIKDKRPISNSGGELFIAAHPKGISLVYAIIVLEVLVLGNAKRPAPNSISIDVGFTGNPFSLVYVVITHSSVKYY